MVFSRVFSAALAAALLFAQGEPVEATPESRAAALFLLISPSVRVNGMGQAGVALPDEPAGYYNPGAAALASPAHTLQSLGMDWNSGSLDLAIGRVTFSKETYRPQIDGVHITSRAEDDKSGIEISILETLAIRRGTYDNFDGEIHLKTSGWTVKSDGLFKFFAHSLDSKSPRSERGVLQFLARHLSISWSRFDYGDRDSSLLGPSLFRGVGHSFIGLSF